MLELYHCAYSTCSQKVRICLAEKGVPWRSHEVDLAAGEQTEPWYLALNPNGVVPTLVVDGQPVIESSVICEYLNEAYPSPALGPSGALERAHLRAWLRFIDEVPTDAVRRPSLQGAIRDRMAALDASAFETLVARKPIRRFLFRRLGRSGFSDAEMAEADEKLDLTLARMDDALARTAWLAGEAYSLADVCMTPLIQRLEDLGLDEKWAERPRVGEWLRRVQARPSFGLAYYPGSHFDRNGPQPVRPASRH